MSDSNMTNKFWISSEIADNFPQLWEKAKLFFMGFPTSYLIESGFSQVFICYQRLVRNRLDIMKRGDLGLSPTTLQPDIQKLAFCHQLQGSH
jgi:hypothetical protein